MVFQRCVSGICLFLVLYVIFLESLVAGHCACEVDGQVQQQVGEPAVAQLAFASGKHWFVCLCFAEPDWFCKRVWEFGIGPAEFEFHWFRRDVVRRGQTLQGEAKDRAIDVLGVFPQAALFSLVAPMLCATQAEHPVRVRPLAMQRCDVVVIIKKGIIDIEGLFAKVPGFRQGSLKRAY